MAKIEDSVETTGGFAIVVDDTNKQGVPTGYTLRYPNGKAVMGNGIPMMGGRRGASLLGERLFAATYHAEMWVEGYLRGRIAEAAGQDIGHDPSTLSDDTGATAAEYHGMDTP